MAFSASLCVFTVILLEVVGNDRECLIRTVLIKCEVALLVCHLTWGLLVFRLLGLLLRHDQFTSLHLAHVDLVLNGHASDEVRRAGHH